MWRRLICLRHDVFLIYSSHLFSIWIIACSDDRLCVEEFSLICRALFRNDQGHIYVVEPGQIHQMFGVFDKNVDGFIDRDEFKFCWNYWIKTVSDWLKIILQAHRPATHSGCLLISPLRAAVSICIESRVDPIWDRIMPFSRNITIEIVIAGPLLENWLIIALFLHPRNLLQIVRPTNAFLVVDVQNDFISGSLNISNCSAQHNGVEVTYKRGHRVLVCSSNRFTSGIKLAFHL